MMKIVVIESWQEIIQRVTALAVVDDDGSIYVDDDGPMRHEINRYDKDITDSEEIEQISIRDYMCNLDDNMLKKLANLSSRMVDYKLTHKEDPNDVSV